MNLEPPTLDTRFIFVEGIMGVGKSTTVEFLTDQFRRYGIAARPVWEGPTLEEPDHPLRIATMFPHPNAIWEDLTVEEFVTLSLQKWRAFAADSQESSVVTVCDGLLFHGNMTDLLLMGASPSVLYQYVARVIESIERLDPVVIYFRHADVAGALRAACDKRGSEDDQKSYTESVETESAMLWHDTTPPPPPPCPDPGAGPPLPPGADPG